MEMDASGRVGICTGGGGVVSCSVLVAVCVSLLASVEASCSVCVGDELQGWELFWLLASDLQKGASVSVGSVASA